MSPLASLLREVFTDAEAAAFSSALLHNMGVPGVVIGPSGDTELTQEQANLVREDFVQRFSGEKRGEPMVLSGKTSVQVLSFNPEQMDLKMLRRLPEERISAVLGVPAIVAGLGAGLDRSTFANMSEAREMAYESTIIPDQRLFAADLRAQLLVDFGDVSSLRVSFDLRNVRVLQEDQNKLWERVNAAVQGGWLMVSRAKEMVGEKPDDGDEVYLRSSSVVLAGPDAPEEPEPEPVPPALRVLPQALLPEGTPPEEPEAEEAEEPGAKQFKADVLLPVEQRPIGEADIGRAFEVWDVTFPELAGLLDAEVERG